MMSNLMKRGWIALAAICLAAVLQATTASAQTLYWQGGAGNWLLSGGRQQWYSGQSSSSVSSGTGSTTWDNVDNVTANIGYLTNSGSGGYYGTTGITQYGQPSVITLDPNTAVNVGQINFGYVGTSSASATASAYELNGGTLNLQNGGGIALDLSYSSAHNPGTMRATVNSDIVAANGTLTFNTLQIAGTGTSGGILDLGGTNSFSTLNIGGITATSAIASGYWSGVVITNPAAFPSGANVVLGNNGELASLCPNGQNITVGSVQLVGNGSYLHNSTYGYYSTTGIGRIGTGAYTDLADASPTITITGPITGPADLSFGSSYGNDGRGVVILNAQSTYSGDTFMNQSSDRWAGDPEGMGIVQLGINNALPVTTNLIFGRAATGSSGGAAPFGNSGALDLHGFGQTVRSIGTMLSGAGSTTNDFCGGITNFNSTPGGAGMGVLNLLNDMGQPASYYINPHFIESQFHGIIGATILDASGRPTDSANSNNNIQLNLLAGTNNGGAYPGFNGLSLTLGLAGSNEAPPAYPVNQSNTYSGGTNISGGALFAANGRVFSTVQGQQNSATGTGYVVVNSGGTLGGSVAGGAVGMPGTGPVTINAGGYLLPGGGYFVSSQGLGAGGYASGATIPTFTAKANLPLNVLGDLNLKAGANVNFNFDATHSDLLIVGGTLSLPAVGSVTINLDDTTGSGTNMASGTPIFEFGSLANSFNPSQLSLGTVTPPNAGVTFQKVGNEIDIVVPGAPQLQRWNGGTNSTWDSTTPNFKYLANLATTYSNGNTVWFDDTAATAGTVNIATSVNPGRVAFLNNSKSYTITGGSITGGAVLVAGGGTATFANAANSYNGGTTIQNSSTLVVSSPTALPTSGTVAIQDDSTLSLMSTGSSTATYSGAISFAGGGFGTGSTPAISVPANQTAVFNGLLAMDINNGVGLNKTGAGTLILANTGAYNTALGSIGTGTSYGAVNIDGGALRVEAVSASGGSTSTNISQLGRGPITIGRTGNGGALWLDNVTINANTSAGLSMGFVDVYSGGTLGGTGSATYAYTNISLVLNTVTPTRPAGSFTLATGSSKTDSLALQGSFEQYDNNSGQNQDENFNLNPSLPLYTGTNGLTVPAGTYSSSNMGTYSPMMTVHTTGAGTVKLQSGETSTYKTFGGAWSVDSGILQVGPFTPAPVWVSSGGSGAQWTGCTGEVLNALGFALPIGQNFRTSAGATPNPDLPNPVTVNNGGILALAVDQLDANPYNTQVPVNPTPSYLRSAVALNGGAIASTGYDVMFYKSGGTAQAVTISGSNKPVVARFGGDFTVGNGVSSASGSGSVLTYDPNGPVTTDSFGNAIVGDSGARVVELVGGSRFLANASPGLSASTTLTYATNWDGTLVVASSGNVGGTFNIKRSGGTVNVLPGASIVVQPYSTVNIADDNSSVLVSSTVAGSTYGFMVAPSSGPTALPVLNNVLSAGGNSVAITNNGTFNVNNGSQTVGPITGNGTFSVTGTASATAPSIVQSAASVGPNATLTLTSPGAVATSLVLTNSGQLNVTGGSHTVGVVGTAGSNVGATSVSGAGATLSAAQLYQNSATASNGGTIVLTAPTSGNLSTFNSVTVQTGKIDVGQSGFYLPTSGSAALFSQIHSGYAGGTWSGSSGITSSLAATSPSSYAVGYAPVQVNGTTQMLVAATIPGDATLEGTVTGADKALVSGTSSNFGKSGMVWSQGNFTYDNSIGIADRAAVIRNLGQSFVPPGQAGVVAAGNVFGAGGISPAYSDLTLASQQVEYNSATGILSLVVSSTADLDAFAVFMQNPPSTANILPNNWQLAVESDQLDWAKQTVGDVSETLQPGTYTLADLPTGLSASAFGNGSNGAGNTAGAIQFYDSSYNTVAGNVEIVPEPGTLALLAAGIAVAGGVSWRKRRSAKRA